MTYIGIDYGTKRVGIAISDDAGVLALPITVVPEKEALATVQALAAERGANTIVVGESKDFSGNENPVMGKIRAFAAALEAAGLAVAYEPEFMTSAAAVSAGASPEMLDASAAAHILQSYLDRNRVQ